VTAAPPGGPVMHRAALLVTDDAGGVLLVRGPAAPHAWSLPGGAVTGGTPAREVALLETARAIGLTPRPGGLLAVDWPAGPPAATAHHVFDGGGISRSARRRVAAAAPAEAEAGAVAFVRPERLAAHAGERTRRVVEAALRARTHGAPAYLEDGHVPAVLAAMRRHCIAPWVHSGSAWTWHDAPVPDDLPIRQSWVWVFAPDGRVVMYVDDAGQAGLPGGTLERFEHRDAAAASLREVREETQIELAGLRYLGYLLDAPSGGEAFARVRMAAAIERVGPAAADPATGTVHRRLLVPPRLAAELCGWGPSAAGQVDAAVRAARHLGIAEPGPGGAVEEIPADGSGVLGPASR
jgi:ADP-ribose pyrophosphatase YjhB (NUDIX family)